MEDWKINLPPETKGFYCVSLLKFGLPDKPHWIHRFFVKLLLGWTWEDYKKEE